MKTNKENSFFFIFAHKLFNVSCACVSVCLFIDANIRSLKIYLLFRLKYFKDLFGMNELDQEKS